MDIIESVTTIGGSAYVAKKVLGPTLDKVGEDFQKLYEKGRDLIIEKAKAKIDNIDDGHQANLRISREVFWSGSFSEEAICAEYFGGILAASRSKDGKDDQNLYFVNVIKNLSSTELHLHYIIYNSFNKYFANNKIKVNVGMESEITRQMLYFDSLKLCEITGFDFSRIATNLNILYQQGLISQFEYESDVPENSPTTKMKSYFKVNPTTFGITLYAISHNRFHDWSWFAEKEFGDFKDIKLPDRFYEKKEDIKHYLLV